MIKEGNDLSANVISKLLEKKKEQRRINKNKKRFRQCLILKICPNCSSSLSVRGEVCPEYHGRYVFYTCSSCDFRHKDYYYEDYS